MEPKDMRSWIGRIFLGALLAAATIGAAPAASAEVNDDPRAFGNPGSGLTLADLLADPEPGQGGSPGIVEAAVSEEDAVADYDPWESFNERMFAFNHGLDRHVMKPVARAWDKTVPEPAQLGFKNAFHNLGMPKRFLNSLFQAKFRGAGRELTRFIVNSTVGLAGLFDVVGAGGLKPSEEDTGQTLGAYGVGPGPYLVLPFLPPLTVRDGFGFAVDSLLDPTSYIAPFVANAGMTVTEKVNERAENLELFEDVEESVLDLYSAVRNGYLQRRQTEITR